MRRISFAIAVLCILTTSGCALHDWIFAALSDQYSGGGVSHAEKQDHYGREIEKWNNYDEFGTTGVPDAPWHTQ